MSWEVGVGGTGSWRGGSRRLVDVGGAGEEGLVGAGSVGTGWEEVAWFVGAGWLGTARVVKVSHPGVA